MGEVKWTEEQKQAIYEKNSNILVAAAAGSGKTAVLVERIINKIINENIDIDKLLVVTFTNAAASEMRERVLEAIYKELDKDYENEKLRRQVTLLNKANICTIDSFCLEIVRNNFYELDNISPNFRIADTTEIELLKQEVIDELFEKRYEEENEDFSKLINTYTGYRDDTPLKELIIKIYEYIQSNPFPEKWLEEAIEMFNIKEKLENDFSTTIWGQTLLEEIEEELIDDISTLQEVEEMLSYDPELDEFQKIISSDIESLSNLKNSLNNWDKVYEIYENIQFITWSRKKVESETKEEAKKIRDSVKDKLGKKLSKILICNSKIANQDIFDMYETLLKLKNHIIEFGQEFKIKKREKNIVDFHDVEHFALQILLKENDQGKLEITETARKYQEKFEEIAIDEYQDSNLVQENILTSISRGNNIFMVGDVKQSIYKFRQAMPDLFLNKYKEYNLKEDKKDNNGLKIKLFKNFRSRDNILDFTNIIFQNIMSNLLGDINYTEDEYLNLGANYDNIEQNLKTEIDIINLKSEEIVEETEEPIEDEEKIENIELEARFVAHKIQKLINDKFQVYDKKTKNFRDITYKDIVILLRSTKVASSVYEQEISKLDMPVFSDVSQEYLDSIEIQTIISLLKIIDNPIQDIPLVTVLRSNIGRFTDNELVQIRLSDKYDNFYISMQKARIDVDINLKDKINKFFNNLDKWRKEQEYLALDELIWKIYSDTGYYNYVGLMPNGELRQANLKMLFERAKQYETASFKGLYNFIKFIEKLRLSSGDLNSAKIIGENDNVIRIMSIHKSKGLEFPVVILSSTGKQFNLMDLNNNILLHQKMGIGVKYIDYEKQVQYDTLSKAAIRSKILTENLSEEMRVLYVALTRAKEKLIITGISKDYLQENEKMQKLVERYKRDNEKINPIVLKKYKKYIDWILLTCMYEENKKNNIFDLNIINKEELMKTFKKIEEKNIDIIEILDEKEINQKELEKIKDILEFEYNFLEETVMPTKTSVSKIKQLRNEEKLLENQEEVYTKEITFDKPKFSLNDMEDKITPMQKGILIHLCMQKLNEKIEYDLGKVKELIKTLEIKEIITKKEADSIKPNKILEFTKSNIWNELKEAKEIYKEKPFYTKSIENSDIIVQGIIDLYYIDKNDNLILLDYKSDYVENGKEYELIEKYKEQLDIYAKALEDALDKKVYKKYIYSTYLDKDIDVY